MAGGGKTNAQRILEAAAVKHCAFDAEAADIT